MSSTLSQENSFVWFDPQASLIKATLSRDSVVKGHNFIGQRG